MFAIFQIVLSHMGFVEYQTELNSLITETLPFIELLTQELVQPDNCVMELWTNQVQFVNPINWFIEEN